MKQSAVVIQVGEDWYKIEKLPLDADWQAKSKKRDDSVYSWKI